MKKIRGFTLIELLIVIAIIAILAAIIYVAVDPVRRLREARNAERWSEVNSILNAYLKYTVDNRGAEPVDLTADVYYMIGSGSNYENCVGHATTNITNLNPNLEGTYLASIPIDPSMTGADGAKTYYYISKNTSGRITVGACNPELVGGSTPAISVSR
jgi:type IV pilus assembly protein PilA